MAHGQPQHDQERDHPSCASLHPGYAKGYTSLRPSYATGYISLRPSYATGYTSLRPSSATGYVPLYLSYTKGHAPLALSSWSNRGCCSFGGPKSADGGGNGAIANLNR